MFIVTQAGIFTCWRSTTPSGAASLHQQRSPTEPWLDGSRSFGSPLIPDHYRRQVPRPVSCYALFKWWLLLSQHPGCQCNLTSFRTKRRLGTLAGGLDFSPLDDGYCHSPSISPGLEVSIRSLVDRGSRVDPCNHPVALPPGAATRGYS